MKQKFNHDQPSQPPVANRALRYGGAIAGLAALSVLAACAPNDTGVDTFPTAGPSTPPATAKPTPGNTETAHATPTPTASESKPDRTETKAEAAVGAVEESIASGTARVLAAYNHDKKSVFYNPNDPSDPTRVDVSLELDENTTLTARFKGDGSNLTEMDSLHHIQLVHYAAAVEQKDGAGPASNVILDNKHQGNMKVESSNGADLDVLPKTLGVDSYVIKIAYVPGQPPVGNPPLTESVIKDINQAVDFANL